MWVTCTCLYAVFIASAAIAVTLCKKRYPKGYKINRHTPTKPKFRPERHRFKTNDHIDQKYDAIIVGSGPSGLATAALLSKINWRVLVLEQNEIIGGGFHSFKLKKHEFESGLHYIGEDKNVLDLLDFIVDKPIEFTKLYPYYDSIVIQKRTINLEAGIAKWLHIHISEFPEYEDEIYEYMKHLCDIEDPQIHLFFRLKALRLPTVVIRTLQKCLCPKYFEMSSRTLHDKLHECGIPPTSSCGAFLSGQYGDHGLIPSKAPFFIHAAVVMHYIRGGCFPTRGTQHIPNSIIPTIHKSGGKVATYAKVTQLHHKNRHITGVTVNGNTFIEANCVISSIGIYNTIQCINTQILELPPNIVLQPSAQFMFLFVSLQGYQGVLPTHNMWIYPNTNFDSIDTYMQNSKDGLQFSEHRPYFISSASSKMGSQENGTITVLTTSKPHYYKTWQHLTHKQRSNHAEYLAWKQDFGAMMLTTLYKHFPDIKSSVVHTEVATPLTVKHYLGASSGEVYGNIPSVYRFSDFHVTPRTKIQGLYLTGQDLITAGIAGALGSAELTANVVAGYGSLKDIFTGSDLIKDIRNLL